VLGKPSEHGAYSDILEVKKKIEGLAFACLFIHAETLHHHLCKKNCL
jgi:hypothetical protein